MNIEQIAAELKAPLQLSGYRRRGMVWYKNCRALTVVFRIQKSQFGADLWYYDFGVGLHALAAKPVTGISGCQITERLARIVQGKELTPDVLLQAIRRWEDDYGDLRALRIRAVENRLPRAATTQAISYLTANFNDL